MSDKAAQDYALSQLHLVTGLAEPLVAEYFVAEAKEAKSLDEFYDKFPGMDVALNEQTRQFGKKLYDLVPHIDRQAQVERERELSRRRLAQANNLRGNYHLVAEVDDDGDIEMAQTRKKRKKDKKEKKDKKKEKKRRKRALGADDVSFVPKSHRPHTHEPPAKRQKREKWTNLDSDELDRLEREELELNLRIKDLEKRKKKFTEDQLEAHNESLRRKALSQAEDDQELRRMTERARVISRRLYLKKRELQQFELRQLEIREDRQMFKHVKTTEREQYELKQKEDQMKVASSIIAKRDEAVGGYHIPDEHERTEDGLIDFEKRDATLFARFEYDEDDRPEQVRLEDARIRSAYRGNANAWEQKRVRDGYKPILQNQREFIAEETEKGRDLKKELEERMAALEQVRHRPEDLQEQRKQLPIFKYKTEILQAIDNFQTLIVIAETGSGKTTQIPQYIWECGKFLSKEHPRIAVTQPRRVAAMSTSARVAKEANVRLGAEVGYSVRFEDKTGNKTVIKYMTDGMLLREFLSSPSLEDYGVIMIDEAHERTLHTDILFGLVKDMVRHRADLKLIISSATLHAQKFSHFFDYAPMFQVPGRPHEVEVNYLKQPETNWEEAVVITVLQIHIKRDPGDILVFLPGQLEIETVKKELYKRLRSSGARLQELVVLPMYANLPQEAQAKIFEPTPPNARKCVLATNIAETSLTIDGIIYVIDPGFAKLNRYNPKTGMDSLVVEPISQAAADQRKGRAGRTAPGVCYRLFTRHSFENDIDPDTTPEIQRTNLGNVVLMLKSLGIDDLVHFDFMDPPPPQALMKALELLYGLKALNDRGELTRDGRAMAEFPLAPELCKCLIESAKYNCTADITTVVAMLSCNHEVYHRPKDNLQAAETQHKNLQHARGDHLTYLKIYQEAEDADFSKAWCDNNFIHWRAVNRAADVRGQLEIILDRCDMQLMSSTDETDICKAICSGFFLKVARLDSSGRLKTVRGRHLVEIHPGSVLNDEGKAWVLFNELVLTSKEYIRSCLEVEPEWLKEVAPYFYTDSVIGVPSRKMPRIRSQNKRKNADKL